MSAGNAAGGQPQHHENDDDVGNGCELSRRQALDRAFGVTLSLLMSCSRFASESGHYNGQWLVTVLSSSRLVRRCDRIVKRDAIDTEPFTCKSVTRRYHA